MVEKGSLLTCEMRRAAQKGAEMATIGGLLAGDGLEGAATREE